MIEKNLKNIKGIGNTRVKLILNKYGISPRTKIGDIAPKKLDALNAHITYLKKLTKTINGEQPVGRNLKKEEILNIKSLISKNSYRGTRHLKGFPVRGQRTRTNGKTVHKRKIKI